MKSTFSTERKGAYVVRLPELQKLWQFIDSNIGPLSLEAKCSDNVNRTFDNWQDFHDYENAANKQIKQLSLSARSGDYNRSINVDFGSRTDYTVSIRISCPDDKMVAIKDDILDLLDGMKNQTLSLFVGKNVFIGFIIFAWFAGFVTFLVSLALQETTTTVELSVRSLLNSITIGIYGGGLIGLIWCASIKVGAKILPPIHFATGQGNTRYENWKTRWRILLSLVAFVLTVSISITAAIVF